MTAERLRVVQIMEATAGGTRRHLKLLLLHLPAERFSLTAIVSDRGEEGFQADLAAFRERGVDLRVAGMVRPIRPLADFRAHRELRGLLEELRPDVIHTHSSKAGVLGRFAARGLRARGTRVYHTPHTFAFQWARGTARSFFARLERIAARHGDGVICLSDTQRELAKDMAIAPDERLLVIPNGVDTSLYRPPSDEERAAMRAELDLDDQTLAVGTIGRLAPQKAVGIFVRAAKIIAGKVPAARFFLAGSGPLEGKIRAQIEELGLAGRFRLLGRREHTERIYGALDLFVLTSLFEGLPYVILEAMATGLPVVATRIPGSADLVAEGRSGLLAEPSGPDEVARHAVALLNDADRRAQYGRAGREIVERQYKLETFIEAHVRLYETGELS